MAQTVSEPNAESGVREPEPSGATISGGHPEAYAPGTMNQTMYK